MKKYLKYVYLVFFAFSAILSLIGAADTSGDSAFDFVIIFIYIITFVFGFATSISFYLSYKRDKVKTNLMFSLLPILLVVLISLVQYSSYKSINKKYFMHFYNTGDSSRNYHYYFRVDSTVKVVGQYFMGTGYDFSPFQMEGNIITIKKNHTDGFKYNRYAIVKDSIIGENRRLLLPINSYGEPLDTLNKLIEILPSDYDY